jgi:hypothetical protein
VHAAGQPPCARQRARRPPDEAVRAPRRGPPYVETSRLSQRNDEVGSHVPTEETKKRRRQGRDAVLGEQVLILGCDARFLTGVIFYWRPGDLATWRPHWRPGDRLFIIKTPLSSNHPLRAASAVVRQLPRCIGVSACLPSNALTHSSSTLEFDIVDVFDVLQALHATRLTLSLRLGLLLLHALHAASLLLHALPGLRW